LDDRSPVASAGDHDSTLMARSVTDPDRRQVRVMCVAAENRLPGQADVDRKDGVNVGWSAPTEHDRPVQRAREASPAFN
jgi:hypothetical protein